METFTDVKSLVDNPDFKRQRRQSLDRIDFDSIDQPISGLIQHISKLDVCFTLQSCWGHFVYKDQKDSHNLELLPADPISGEIEYRIAYLAICLENSQKGERLLNQLKRVESVDKHNIQLGCADWFWSRQVNSYALQVEPERFKYQDSIRTDYQEALVLQKVKHAFFKRLNEIFFELD